MGYRTVFRLIIVLALSLICLPVYAAEVRILYNSVEDSYSTHPLEAQWGSSTQSYVDIFVAESSRVADGHTGSYSIEFDVSLGDPHAVVGYNGSLLNTDNFYFEDYNSTEWFWRWWFKADSTALSNYGSILAKHLYVNYSSGDSTVGDFVLSTQLFADGPYPANQGFHLTWHQGKDYPDYSINSYPLFGKEIFDDEWHCFEVYVHVGSGNNNTDAICRVWVDDVQIYNNTSVLSSASSISSSPIEYMAGWPGSTSGTADGSAPYLLDDFEIYADISSGGESTTGSMSDGTITVSSGGDTTPATIQRATIQRGIFVGGD